MRIARVFLSVAVIVSTALCAFAQDAPKKKLIELGWDIPTTGYIREHWQEMEKDAPFDGIIYDLTAKNDEGNGVASQSLFTSEPWKKEWFESCVRDLESCDFQRYQNNFIRINFYPTPFDWADEESWKNVCEKAAICAWVARETKGGLCFDFESYGAEMFKHDPSTGRSFEESKQIARQRGAEMCEAICKEYPDVVVLCLWMNSVNADAGRSEYPDLTLRRGGYGLLPSFIDGMLDAVAPETTLVDGCENGYYMNGSAQYDRAACDMLLATGPAVRLVSPENRKKYRSQVQAGFGFYLDMYSNPEGSAFYRGAEPGETRLDRLVANLRSALAASDEYVWVYGEQKRWWTPENAKSNDDWTSWEEALPGLTDRIFGLADPAYELKSVQESVLSDPNAENLCVNGGFSDVDANGMPASWSFWQIETHPTGEFKAVDGAAVIEGAQNGCFIQSVEAKPGETFLVTGKVKATGESFGNFRVRWQGDRHNWVSQTLDVMVYPDFDAQPDESGYVELTGFAVVPNDACYLVLLLSASGSEDEVVSFDDVKIYRAQKR
ncbi:MAG: hypothetical protein IK077_00615 [Thermoguttaceae bacterium]|nr:hypothetical protein [Thermoguttaceae bacterium]